MESHGQKINKYILWDIAADATWIWIPPNDST